MFWLSATFIGLDDGPTHLDGVEETESSTGGVAKVFSPVLQSLKTVHHRSIVSVTHRGDEEEHLSGQRYLVIKQSSATHDNQIDLEQIASIPSCISAIQELT